MESFFNGEFFQKRIKSLKEKHLNSLKSGEIFCKKDIKSLYRYFIYAIREINSEPVNKHTLRRWNIFYIHLNVSFALLLGAIISVFICIYTCSCGDTIKESYYMLKLILELVFIIYIISSIYLMKDSRNEVIEIECDLILNRKTQEKEEGEK